MTLRKLLWEGHDGEGNFSSGFITVDVVDQSNQYYGWDPNSWEPPANELPVWPFHDNVGLFEASRRTALTPVGTFTSSQAGQRVQGIRVTGETTINHKGVVFEFCQFEDQINVNVDDATLFIYCDIGYKNGAASTSSVNMIDGPARLYRCNFYNWVDGIAIKKSSNSTVPVNVVQDCFAHDSRIVPSDGANSPSHNDLVLQSNQSNTKFNLYHNTIFCSGTNNTGGKSETCSRDSGPHWSGPDPISAVFDPPSNGVTNGRINASVMLKASTGCTGDIRRNLFRGYCYTFLNVVSGNNVKAVDNVIAKNENDPSKPDLSGTYKDKSGNVDLNGNPL